MKLTVRLFAAARQAAGQDSIVVTLPDGATVAQLRDQMAADLPQLSGLLRHMTFAVNARYAANGTVLDPKAEVACIPPVSGG